MVPSAPVSMRRLASAYPVSKRLWKPTWSVAPDAATSRAISTVSSYPSAIGFSQKAGMPASKEARIKGACAGVDAAITTASGPEPSTASMCPASPPTSCATSSARCGSASPTSISSTLGSRASTPAWRAPIRPAPSSPTFIRVSLTPIVDKGTREASPALTPTHRQRCYWSAHPASTGARALCKRTAPSAQIGLQATGIAPRIVPLYARKHPTPQGSLEMKIAVVEKTGSLASYAVAEVRGGCFVEKKYGALVIPQHRGRHAFGDLVLHGGGHGACLVRARGEEQD